MYGLSINLFIRTRNSGTRVFNICAMTHIQVHFVESTIPSTRVYISVCSVLQCVVLCCSVSQYVDQLVYMDLYICVLGIHFVESTIPTGWRRPIGYLKLQVIFAKEPLDLWLFCGK